MKSVSLRETKEQKLLRQLTQNLKASAIQISPDQGQFMAMLVKLIGAKQIIEIGTFTGYSALSMALALPDDGNDGGRGAILASESTINLNRAEINQWA